MPIAPHLLAGKQVLVLEDDGFFAAYVGDAIVCAGGVVVGPFASVADCLAGVPIGREAIDAAVLDVRLRGGVCYPVADALARARIPMIFVSGGIADMPARFRTCPSVGKPLASYQVVQALARLLDPSALMVEARR